MTDNDSLLARLDERTENMQRQLTDLNKALKEHYVTKAEFEPVKRLVYGGVGVVLQAVTGGVVALVLK